MIQGVVEKLANKHKEAEELASNIRRHADRLNEFADRLESGDLGQVAKACKMSSETQALLVAYNQLRAAVHNLAAQIRSDRK